MQNGITNNGQFQVGDAYFLSPTNDGSTDTQNMEQPSFFAKAWHFIKSNWYWFAGGIVAVLAFIFWPKGKKGNKRRR